MSVEENLWSLYLNTRRRYCSTWWLAGAVLAAVNALAAASITLSHPQPLGFGKFAAGTGGTVTVYPNGTRTRAGGVVLVPSASGSAAHFGISGEPGTSYSITLPANGTVLLSSGPNSMPVNNFTSTPSATGQLGMGGTQALSVGATLGVAGNQPPGSYAGSFNISIDYN